MEEGDELVTLGWCHSSDDRDRAENTLKAAGIEHLFTGPPYALGAPPEALQVRARDEKAALAVLRDRGVLLDGPDGPNGLLRWFDRITAPWAGRLHLGHRFLIAILSLGVVAMIPVYFLMASNIPKLLRTNTWCVDSATADGRPIELHVAATGPLRVVLVGCPQAIEFDKDGGVSLPAGSGSTLQAHWQVAGGRLIISSADPGGEVLEGTYAVHIKNDQLELRSERVELIAHSWR